MEAVTELGYRYREQRYCRSYEFLAYTQIHMQHLKIPLPLLFLHRDQFDSSPLNFDCESASHPLPG